MEEGTHTQCEIHLITSQLMYSNSFGAACFSKSIPWTRRWQIARTKKLLEHSKYKVPSLVALFVCLIVLFYFGNVLFLFFLNSQKCCFKTSLKKLAMWKTTTTTKIPTILSRCLKDTNEKAGNNKKLQAQITSQQLEATEMIIVSHSIPLYSIYFEERICAYVGHNKF